MGHRQLPIEYLCMGGRQLQLGVKRLPLKSICVGVSQLQLDVNWS